MASARPVIGVMGPAACDAATAALARAVGPGIAQRGALLGSWRFDLEGVSTALPRASDADQAVALAFAGLPAARP